MSVAFQPVHPLEWSELPAVSSRFISDIAIVAGEVDVAAPVGFTKLPGDLNFAADGDYAYLCVKRGGPRALTQLQVQVPGSTAKPALTAPHAVSVDYQTGSGMLVIGYETESLLDITSNGSTQAITDIAIVYGDQEPVPNGFIKIPTKVNNATSAVPVYLHYRLAPIGGFVCNSSSDHSEFGECLFASRFCTGKENFQSTLRERATLSDERTKIDLAQLNAHYAKHQPAMLKRLKDGLQRAQSYETKSMQEDALKHIPVALLEERAHANPSPMATFKDEVLMQLLHWFKREFFTWMNQPRCSACNHEKTRSVRTEGPMTAEEVAGQAGRVEVYQCPSCNSLTRFPRYNDPVKLLTSRTGRCGEWANCFTLCCRAMGYEARYVLDVTDHVWTEVYSEHFKRWLHCDSCEDQLDSPLTYEVGWGKKLSYIFSFSCDEVIDSAKRYTQNWDGMRSRRRDVSEEWLKTVIIGMNQTLRQRLPSDRVELLLNREKVEQEEFRRGRTVKKSEVQGRVSGSSEWKSGRQEDGKAGTGVSGEKAADLNNQQEGEGNDGLSKADILQEIFRNLVVGCGNKSCKNPYCANCPSSSAKIKQVDPNERAAGAIQAIAALNDGFSSAGLSMLLCPKSSPDIRAFVHEFAPEVYYPLQGGSNDSVLDISGHDHHIDGSDRKAITGAMRKPFRLPHCSSDGVAFGMQLLNGQQFTFGKPSTSEVVLSLLIRMDDVNAFTPNDVTEDNSTCLEITERSNSNTPTMSFQVTQAHGSKKLACRLQHKSLEALSSDSAFLVFGQYYHLALVISDKRLAAFIDGGKSVELDINKHIRDDGKAESSYTIASSNHAVTISHLAIVPLKSVSDPAAFGFKMAAQFVSAPPLRAYGANGSMPDKRCSEQAASVRSGYRVSRIQSTYYNCCGFDCAKISLDAFFFLSTVWGNEFLDGVQFIYAPTPGLGDKPVVRGALIGNSNAKKAADSPATIFEFWEDEFITEVSGRKGAWMDSITFKTSYGREVRCGGYGGNGFIIKISPGSEVRAIGFNTGDHLTNPVVFVSDDSSLTPLGSSTLSLFTPS